MALKVLGTGLGRTGTHSLKIALEQLGFGKCYHMFELFSNPEGLTEFEKAEKGQTPDWDKLFTGYQSAVDYPVARYYKQLLTKYPDAKVVHTTRDANSWYDSCVETIFWASKPDAGRIFSLMVKMPFSSTLRKRFPVLKYDGKLLDWEFGRDLKNKAEVIKRFNQRNEEILKLVPKERLLVYNVADGWEPLCKFLNVPVPSTPFPKSNVRESFKEGVKKIATGEPLVMH
jgi:hypothetical protein